MFRFRKRRSIYKCKGYPVSEGSRTLFIYLSFLWEKYFYVSVKLEKQIFSYAFYGNFISFSKLFCWVECSWTRTEQSFDYFEVIMETNLIDRFRLKAFSEILQLIASFGPYSKFKCHLLFVLFFVREVENKCIRLSEIAFNLHYARITSKTNLLISNL